MTNCLDNSVVGRCYVLRRHSARLKLYTLSTRYSGSNTGFMSEQDEAINSEEKGRTKRQTVKPTVTYAENLAALTVVVMHCHYLTRFTNVL